MRDLGRRRLQHRGICDGLAISVHDAAAALYERILGPDDPKLATVLQRWGDMRLNTQRPAEAEPLYERALAICEKTLGPNHPQTAYALNSVATLRTEQGRHAVAEQLARRALDILQRAMGSEHLGVSDAWAQLARIYIGAGRYPEAERAQREALRLVEQQLVARSGAPADRRRAVLRLTKRGARVNAARDGTVEAAMAQALEGVSDRDRMATRRVLERLAAHLEPSATAGPTNQSRVRSRTSRERSGEW